VTSNSVFINAERTAQLPQGDFDFACLPAAKEGIWGVFCLVLLVENLFV